MEIEYVSAPLELDFLEGAAAAEGDEDMPAAAGLGLGSEQPAAEGGPEGEEQPPSLAADFQRFGTVEELLGAAPVQGEEAEGAGGAGAPLALTCACECQFRVPTSYPAVHRGMVAAVSFNALSACR